MPYITQTQRAALGHRTPDDVGELTYEITAVVQRFLAKREPRFKDFAEALGALEAAKLELYRRQVAPYEDQKCAENGDVFLAPAPASAGSES